jgi:hypothetical protein
MVIFFKCSNNKTMSILKIFTKAFDRAADFFIDKTMIELVTMAFVITLPKKNTTDLLSMISYAFVVMIIMTAMRDTLKISVLKGEISELKEKKERSVKDTIRKSMLYY